jgi:hypothetical protein
MTQMLDDTVDDLRQIIADLQRKLDERTAELHENKERYALVSQAVAEGIYDWDIENNGCGSRRGSLRSSDCRG